MNICSSIPERQYLPREWKVVPFDKAFSDVTGGNVKIKQSDYKPIGLLPILDQGQAQIAGYVDDLDLTCQVTLPVVLFGDHTKIIKFVNTPFVLGADGVKVLAPCPDLDAKFGYYYLQLVRFPLNTGYSRHFKFLKEIEVPLPPLNEQHRIVAILDKADTVRRKRAQSIRLTEELIRSVFLDMFGDPVTNQKGWPIEPLENLVNFATGKLDSNAAVKYGIYPFFTCAREDFRIDKWAFDCEALLLAGNNATADYSVKYYKGKFNAYQRTYVLTISRRDLSYWYMKYALEMKLDDMKRLSKGTNTKYLTLGLLNQLQFQVPGKSVQHKFDALVTCIIARKKAEANALLLANNLFESCAQRAFRGEL